ncbi:hypothetical protein BH10ACI3_BH10ACI3_06790 [soil metagenome]
MAAQTGGHFFNVAFLLGEQASAGLRNEWLRVRTGSDLDWVLLSVVAVAERFIQRPAAIHPCNIFPLTRHSCFIYSSGMSDEFADLKQAYPDLFVEGVTDYDSQVERRRELERREAAIAESKKREPRLWSPKPDMLYIEPTQFFLDSGAETAPVKQLFGPFWVYGEMAVLFASAGVGKSVLATQIGESVARGVPFAPFDNYTGPAAGPQRVLYLDFELSREQLALRYTIPSGDGCLATQKYTFSPNMHRAEHMWSGRIIDGYEDYTDMLFTNIAEKVEAYDAEVLIIDNITFLTRGSTANAVVAFRLMKRLQELKKEHWLSILVLAHTPKRRRDGPINDCDLQGSVDLSKVVDSAFAIGRSRRSRDLRYIKQTKVRSARMAHGDDNVAIFKLGKYDFGSVMNTGGEPAKNFLGFRFEMFDNEENHVELRSSQSSAIRRRPRRDTYLVNRAKALAEQGLSSSAVAERLGVGKSTAHRYMSEV